MKPNLITIDQAIAQGSSWTQILAIARFHDGAAAAKSVSELTLLNMPKTKAKELRSTVAFHRRAAEHFRAMSEQLRHQA